MAERLRAFWRRWLGSLGVGAVLALVMAIPGLRVPLAQMYAALCERFPILALLTRHLPALPMALLLSLVTLAVLAGGWAGATALVATMQLKRRLHRRAAPLPARLARVGNDLELIPHLTYVPEPRPMACCYGLLRPRIAITAGLVERLDDDELAAVLGHERAHLRRRDPLRHLALEMLTAVAFMFPVATALRERLEAQMELAADRAALAIAPPAALAGALLAGIAPAQTPPGIAGLSATEARIAHLAGRSELPLVPLEEVGASLGVVAMIGLATIDLARTADVVRVMCSFCPWLA